MKESLNTAATVSNETFSSLFETMDQGVVYQDAAGVIIRANPAAERILGLTREQIMGRSSLDPRWKCIREDGSDISGDEHPSMIALRTGRPVIKNVMGMYLPDTDELRWIIVSSVPDLFRDGVPQQIITTFTDITDLKNTEERLQQSEKRFHNLFDTMHEGFAFHEVICNAAGEVTDYRYLDLNQAFEQLTGLKRETTVGRTVREVLPEIEEEWIQCFGRVALTGIPDERESHVRELDRYYRARAYSPEKGKFAVVFEETTTERRAQRELERREALYNDLIETATDLVWRCDTEGRYTFLNRAWESAFGYSLDEMLGHRFTEFMTAEQAERDSTLFAQLLATSGRVRDHETVHLSKDGTPVHLVFNATFYHDDHGEVVGTQGTAHNITLRKEQERALRESELFLRKAQQSARIGIYEFDIVHDRWHSSSELDTIFGIDATYDRTFSNWLCLINPEWRERMAAYFADLLASRKWFEMEYLIVRPVDGQSRWVYGTGEFEYDDNGKAVRMFGTIQDVTDRKRLEEERLALEKQLLHAQKLESLGVLAGGIAHDFNNILTAIIGNADLALMRLNKESPVLENLRKIEQAAARAADLARQMLAYSGKGKFVVEAIDLNRLIEEMFHMLEVSISKKAVLKLNPYHPLPSVEADATQIRQIIMNLVINASEAIGDRSGIIAVTTGVMGCDRNYLKDVWLDDNISEGLYVYLEIADTGCGMDKETLAKLFDPFFTTKFTGRGLGMAAVLGIVRGHKGAIKVYSEPNRGTTFKVLLPASERPAELFSDTDHSDHWLGSGTVLLVDDEETVRGIGGEMLNVLGFEVLTANDGREALETYRNNPGIALVLLDLTMPHMDGEQCFRELRQLDPKVKVIMSSGFSEQEVTQKFAGKGLAGFIQKPYKLNMLKEVIRRI